jgi:hypothetical protein
MNLARQLEEWHREYNAGRDTSGYSAKQVLAKTHALAQMSAAELAGARYMGAPKAVWRDPLRGTGLLSKDQVTAFQSLLRDLIPTSDSLFSQAVRASAPQEWAAEWASKKPPSP